MLLRVASCLGLSRKNLNAQMCCRPSQPTHCLTFKYVHAVGPHYGRETWDETGKVERIHCAAPTAKQAIYWLLQVMSVTGDDAADDDAADDDGTEVMLMVMVMMMVMVMVMAMAMVMRILLLVCQGKKLHEAVKAKTAPSVSTNLPIDQILVGLNFRTFV